MCKSHCSFLLFLLFQDFVFCAWFIHYCADDKLFDASQYAFFGRPTTEKVEFGCLEEDEDNPSTGVPDDEYHLFDREEV